LGVWGNKLSSSFSGDCGGVTWPLRNRGRGRSQEIHSCLLYVMLEKVREAWITESWLVKCRGHRIGFLDQGGVLGRKKYILHLKKYLTENRRARKCLSKLTNLKTQK
jgi:hypothetical protein